MQPDDNPFRSSTPEPEIKEDAPLIPESSASSTQVLAKFSHTCLCGTCRVSAYWAIAAVVSNEMTERFAFYSVRALLVVYLTLGLKFDQGMAVTIYSFFNAACYLSPLLGGYIADSHLGKFNTILLFNAFYVCGIIVLAGTAFEYSRPGMFMGLALMAVGTGGIKPCISPFGVEQLPQADESSRRSFFSYFYWGINIGAAASFIVTPMIRVAAGFGLAFTIAAVLLVASVAVFLMPTYVKIPPSRDGSAWTKIFKYIRAKCCCACSSRVCGQSQLSPEDWKDLQGLYRLVPLFAVFPLFWAVYDSQASIWTLQRMEMDNCVGTVCLQPEQLGALNPILVLVMIPLLDRAVYPALYYFAGKCRTASSKNISCLEPTPLRRIAVGFQFAVLAFVATAVLQAKIDEKIKISFLWQLPQFVLLTVAEIMVSVTGLEYAFSQAPLNMRSTVLSMYFLSVSLGNLVTGVLYASLSSVLSPLALILTLTSLLFASGLTFVALVWKVI
jgi:POT family proton-dependent oligopeptide transporter